MTEPRKERGLFLRNGLYWVDVQVQGRRVRRSTGTDRLRLAQAVLDRIRSDLVQQEHLGLEPPPSIRLGKLARQHLARPAPNARDPYSVRPLLAFFGSDKPAATITQADVLKYQANRASSRSRNGRRLSASVNREVACLRSCFNWASRSGLFNENPAARIPKLHEGERTRIPNQREVESLIAASSQGPVYLRPIVVLAVNTGARLGELLSLQWQHVDWQRRSLWIAHGKGQKDRHLPLNSQAIEALNPCRAARSRSLQERRASRLQASRPASATPESEPALTRR